MPLAGNDVNSAARQRPAAGSGCSRGCTSTGARGTSYFCLRGGTRPQSSPLRGVGTTGFPRGPVLDVVSARPHTVVGALELYRATADNRTERQPGIARPSNHAL